MPVLPPPPSQFANRSSPSASALRAGGKVKVLPALSAPVALADTSDADRLIEELMAEAERDPGLRQLSGLDKSGQRGRPTTPEALSPQKYPMVKRPYRTQQDMIIRDEVDDAAAHTSSSRMTQSSGSFASRSKSADARPREARSRPAPRQALPGLAAPSASRAPAAAVKRTASSDNMLNLLEHDVPSDSSKEAHLHSVRDLVAMIEKNTKSQSANAYVRKWGCDLISPEPHTKTVTYRRERRRLEDANGMRREEDEEGGAATKRNTTYNWTKDDEFQRKHQMGLEQFGQQFGQPSTQGQQQDYADYGGGGGGSSEFRMSSHLADLDSLLGKRGRNDEEDLEVQWPPPSNASPMPPPGAQPEYRQQDFHIPQEMQTAENGGTYFENRRRQQLQSQKQGGSSNVVEVDRQIKNIQNKFDTELDSLIDAYRDVQKSVQMTVATSSTASASTAVGGSVKGSPD